MKKIHYLSVFFILSVYSLYGQITLNGNSYYNLEVDGIMSRRSNGCGDIDGLKEINVIKQKAGKVNLFSDRYIYRPFSINPFKYYKNDLVESVQLRITQRWISGYYTVPKFGWPPYQTITDCSGGPNDIFPLYSITECFVNSYYNQGDGLDRITISSKPVINIPVPSTPLYLTDTGYLTVTLPDNIDNKYFKWKYSVGGAPEDPIPHSYNYKSTIHIKGSDFLKKEDFGKNVSVWIDLKSVCPYCENPSPINFVYLKALPALTNPNYSVIVTKCAGDKVDYKLQFDRALENGEMINFNITGVGTTENPTPFSYSNIDLLEEGNTFTFRNLKAGTYSVTYKGRDSANSYSPHTEENPFIFTIVNPEPVRFLKVSTPNPSCNGTSDGQIVIGAFGGTENNYKIEINGVWHNFSSRVTHVFKNLREGIYTIRVKDGNGCIAKLRDTNRETITIELKDPDPITISYPPDRQKLPSFNGASDGYITAVIKGGTPLYFGEKKYNFVWENAKRDTLTNTDFHYPSPKVKRQPEKHAV
ncbi:MAG: hypothetical protein ACFNVX_09675 [Lachnoanaerobaculum saburreum]